jgi:hypothetical protein
LFSYHSCNWVRDHVNATLDEESDPDISLARIGFVSEVWLQHSPVARFTGILRAAFLPNILRQKYKDILHGQKKTAHITFVQKKLFIKCW